MLQEGLQVRQASLFEEQFDSLLTPRERNRIEYHINALLVLCFNAIRRERVGAWRPATERLGAPLGRPGAGAGDRR